MPSLLSGRYSTVKVRKILYVTWRPVPGRRAAPTFSALPAQDRAGLSDQHEGRVVSEGNGDGDAHGTVDRQACNRNYSGTG